MDKNDKVGRVMILTRMVLMLMEEHQRAPDEATQNAKVRSATMALDSLLETREKGMNSLLHL